MKRFGRSAKNASNQRLIGWQAKNTEKTLAIPIKVRIFASGKSYTTSSL